MMFSGKKLKWELIGVIGEIVVSVETFRKCCVVNSEPGEIDIERLNSYKHSEEIDKMFEWYIENGFGRISEKSPNTGVYVKIKPDGSKLQIISDRSMSNDADRWLPKSFRLFSPDDMKLILRCEEDVWFYSFDVSNFFHSFAIPEEMAREVPVIYRWVQADGRVVSVEALRLVFGSKFSPIVSHAEGCNVIGTKDTVYEKKVDGGFMKLRKGLGLARDVSGMYIDDFLEASTVKSRAEGRYRENRRKIEERGCGIKPKAVVEDVMEIEFAEGFL